MTVQFKNEDTLSPKDSEEIPSLSFYYFSTQHLK